MRLTDILEPNRVLVVRKRDGFSKKTDVLARLAQLLADGTGLDAETIQDVLEKREQLQSTGIGDGVAIPHGSLDQLEKQCAAIVLCPDGVPFDAIDGRPVTIVVGVVGPRRATGEHLRMLARISRLLHDGSVRNRLLASSDGNKAYEVIAKEEEERP